MSQQINIERVQELLRHDEETGDFFWKHNRRGHAKAGDKCSYTNHAGYIVIKIDGIKVMAHRLAWLLGHGSWPNGDIDHINGNRTDNRLQNLRDVDRTTNLQNQRQAQPKNRLGILGVSEKNGRYRARIKAHGKVHELGIFSTPTEASAAYINAKRQLHQGNTL